jgi:tetratricopeptide (TPR) repeat protein
MGLSFFLMGLSMLTLHLAFDGQLGSVYINGRESHVFSLMDLGLTKQGLKDFVANPQPYGGKLFKALFKDASEARRAFDDLSKQVERTIILVLESSELDGIAWEYAYHDNAYIVEDFAFIRALPEKERPHSNGRLSKSVERVPLLFIPANPLVDLSGEPMRELDIESEWREMTQHIVKSNAPFDLIELRPPTPAVLQSVMARFQNGMIAHFSGHGAATKDGAFLLFENENGSSNPLEAREFVREIKDQAWIGFLSACQSAVAERTVFGNLARELVKAGVPFALGMQFNLPDLFAPNISGQFYNYLSQGHAVPDAARQARRAVKRENEFYVGMIALYAAHPDEAGKMEWSGSGARTLSTFAVADVSDLPTPSGFIGRQRELMNIGTKLLEKKKPNTVTLHGAGGIGKTALMRQTLLRFAPSFEAALAIVLDPLPSLDSVSGRIERFLNLPSPCSNDTKEREQILRGKLTGRETLLGLDNFETLIHARDNGSNEEKKTAKSLYAFFKRLAAEGVTLCVTSRENTSLPGEMIQEILGLEDEVGGRLFQNTISTRRDALNEIGLEKISAAVGGHPLALRLLAPIFEEQAGLTLDDFIQKLETFLPEARDEWTEQERHESLRACFAFSMDNLPSTAEGNELQIAFLRLSIFTAFFLDFTAAAVLEGRFLENTSEFLQMAPKINRTLHGLWERGLLERIILPLKEGNLYLYRLHPTIRNIAKERLTDIDKEMAKTNYWQSLDHLVGMAEENVSKSPFIAQIVFHAVPDLIVAAGLKKDENGVRMQIGVSKILGQFGFYDDSLRLLEKINNNPEALNEKAYILAIRGNLDEALRRYQQSLEILERLGNLQGKAATLADMAEIHVTYGDLDKAVTIYQQVIELAETLGDQSIKSGTLSKMANVFFARGDLGGAMNLYQKSLAIEQELNDLKAQSVTLYSMANIYFTLGDMDKAMKIYEDVLENFKKLKDLHDVGATLNAMAGIYLAREDYEEAMKLYQQSVEIAEVLGDLQGKSTALHNVAQIYVAQGYYDEAMKLYQQSLEISEDMDYLHGKAATLFRIAEVRLKQGASDVALQLFQEVLEIQKKLGALDSERLTLRWIAIIEAKKFNFDKALSFLKEAVDIEKGLESFDLDKNESSLELIDKILAIKKDYQRSFEQIIIKTVQAAREKRIETKEYLKSSQKMAGDLSSPAEVRELGKVLSGILSEDTYVDLTTLTSEFRGMVEKALER